MDRVAATVDARRFWPRLATALAEIPDGEGEALLLLAWEELSYEEIATAAAHPSPTFQLQRSMTSLPVVLIHPTWRVGRSWYPACLPALPC